MEIKRSIPHPCLRDIVRSFEERRGDLGKAVLTWPVAARPHQILDIHLAQPFQVSTAGGLRRNVPDIGLVGPQTSCRFRVYISGEIDVFNVLFQPAGLHRLIGIDMGALVDQDPPAADVLGQHAAKLGDAVRGASDFPARVRAAERALASILNGRSPSSDISEASRLLVQSGGQMRIDDVVRRSALSARQFQRRFAQEVGLTPKRYAQLIRFDRALVMRHNTPTRPWTEILHELGYFDQAHFVREFRALAGVTPTGLSSDWENIFFPANG